jgi:hypothetical protein
VGGSWWHDWGERVQRTEGSTLARGPQHLTRGEEGEQGIRNVARSLALWRSREESAIKVGVGTQGKLQTQPEIDGN